MARDANPQILQRLGDGLTLTERELFERLMWFTHVRWFMAAGTLALLVFCWYVLGVRFHLSGRAASMAPAVYVTLHIFAYNTVFTLLVRRARVRGQMNRRVIVVLALGQIACDMTAVTALVHHTGGVENYFVILVLLPMVIASELLPQGLAYATAAGASVLINALAWGEYQGVLRHVHVDLASGSDGSVAQGLHTDWMYVLQVTAALSVMSFAMVFIASAISKRLRLRERELEEAYRRLARTDEAKSFFMRKAGHEMRAPLAAISSILDAVGRELADSLGDEPRRLMTRASKRSRTLMGLVDDLRRYSRLRATPPTELKTRPVALHELAA